MSDELPEEVEVLRIEDRWDREGPDVVVYRQGGLVKLRVEYPEPLDKAPYFCVRAALDAYARDRRPPSRRLDWSDLEPDPEMGCSMHVDDFLEAAIRMMDMPPTCVLKGEAGARVLEEILGDEEIGPTPAMLEWWFREEP